MHRRSLALAGPLPLTLVLALLALAGCNHAPRVATPWAAEARGVISAATPDPDDLRTPVAEYGYAEDGPAEERERDDLASLDGAEGLGVVRVELGEGVYVLESEVWLDDTAAFVLVGEGSHKTRLQLDTETFHSLRLRKVGRVELRGVTVAGYTGGGIFIEDCPDVVLEDAHFAGSRVGVSLESSTAHIGTSVFAGCEAGVYAEDSEVVLRETAFLDCWTALVGEGAAFDLEGCAFVENRDAVAATLDDRSRVISCLFGGNEQSLAWEGRPKVARDNLAHIRDLGDRLGRFTNLELGDPADFPRAVRWPDGFDVVAVHLALERARQRGEADPPERLEEVGRAEAEAFARASQRALRARDFPAARLAAKIALRYLGDQELSEAPQAVIDVAELARAP